MFLIECIPIKSSFFKESLTYFYKEAIPVGSLISVPLRNKLQTAIVIYSKEAADEKQMLRNSNYSLRKVSRVKSAPILLESFIEASKQTSLYFGGSAGSLISLLTSSHILENASRLPTVSFENKIEKSNTISEHLVIQDEENDRMATYRSLIREEFAKNHSVFFCLPTNTDVKKVFTLLDKGIGEYAYYFHAQMDKKEMLEKWKRAVEEKHPILIVATATFLSIPRNDFGMIIVEKESSRHYKLQKRPYPDVRTFALNFADLLGAKVVFGDIALRVETIHKVQSGFLSGILPPKYKYLSSARGILADMKENMGGEKNNLISISPALARLIVKNKEHNEHLLIYAGRRGLSPTTICNDCGEIVKCSNCSTPTVLHRRGNKNIYLCHRCNNVEDPERRCENCGSWKLQALGIGIGTVHSEISDNFQNIQIYRVDSDVTISEKKVLSEIEKWQNTPGSILLTTELGLPYINSAENIAIASIDSLFSVPDFRINEKILGLILQLRSMAVNNFILQTRNKEQTAVKAGFSGNLLDFYRTEIEERKEFGYPPFYTFVKITLEGNKSEITKEMNNIAGLFDGYEFDIFPAMAGKLKGKAILNSLLRLKKEDWPNDDLLHKLLSLPPKYIIKVDPESLL
jgi:primosomal protein N'